MAATMAKDKTMSPADKKWGFTYGVDGEVSRLEAAELLGVSVRTIDLYGSTRRIRKGKNAIGEVAFCKRSVMLMKKFREV